MERVRRGDREAFGALVHAYLRPAFSVAYRILENRADAEDLVQEAFLVALDRIDTFEPGRPFGPWFYRIVWNRGLNARERRSRRATEELPETAAAPGPDPSERAELSDRRRRLRAAMDGLSERQRDVLRLSELEGFSGPEVAEILGIADGTVRWHLHEARAALREALAAEGGSTGPAAGEGRRRGGRDGRGISSEGEER